MPIMKNYLQPFIDLMKELQTQGFEVEIQGNPQRLRVMALQCVLDSKAHPPIQNFHHSNYGEGGCPCCGEAVNEVVLLQPRSRRREVQINSNDKDEEGDGQPKFDSRNYKTAKYFPYIPFERRKENARSRKC